MGVKTVIYIVSGVFLAVLLYSKFSSPPIAPEIPDGWYGKGQMQTEDDPTIMKIQIDIPDDVLTDLKHKLENTRYTDHLEDTTFNYGFSAKYLREIVGYWKNDYDWRKHEAILNSFPQYKTQIEGINVHFLRVTPPSGFKPGRKPILILHGWPGSVWEFYKFIPRLTQPERFGGQVEDAQEVICPSIPGYGFSEKPHKKRFSEVSAARIFVKLMKRLGYEEFYVQGGDFGALIAIIMAQVYPGKIFGLHLNAFPVNSWDPKTMAHQIAASLAPSLFLDENDQKKIGRMFDLSGILRETGYLRLQATRPDTVGQGLSDSPAGLAAYILEKFSVWTNPSFLDYEDGGLTKRFTLDELLTGVMIYWVTDTITSSMRFYKEHFMDENIEKLESVPVMVPTGLASFPHELFGATPKVLLRYKYKNIIQYTEMPDGGHFAAFEQPELLANDVLNFLRKVKRL